MTNRKPKPMPAIKLRGRYGKQLEPRLCPTCWNAMRFIGGEWDCPKHGKPTRP